MKNYIMCVCETCGFETPSYDEMFAHEASHLGLSVEEYREYIKLQMNVKYLEERIIFDRSSYTCDSLKGSKIKLLNFEKDHDIAKYKENPIIDMKTIHDQFLSLPDETIENSLNKVRPYIKYDENGEIVDLTLVRIYNREPNTVIFEYRKGHEADEKIL